jgi:hypothetical protein
MVVAASQKLNLELLELVSDLVSSFLATSIELRSDEPLPIWAAAAHDPEVWLGFCLNTGPTGALGS